MAQNFHKDLPNNQIHNPKDFSSALSRSVMTKDYQNVLQWKNANYTTVTTIKCYDDSSGRTGGTWFKLYSDYDGHKYQVWFDVDNGSLAPDTISGYTRVEVDISSGDNANTIAAALQTKIDSLTGITATVSTDTVTIASIKTATNPTDVNTNFLFNSTQSVVKNEILSTNSSGHIKWKTGEYKMYHQFEASHAPKGTGPVGKYHIDNNLRHSGKGLSTNLNVTSVPASIARKDQLKASILTLPAEVQSARLHYTVWHADTGSQAVNWRFCESKLESGTSSAATITEIGSITDTVAASEHSVKDIPLVTTVTEPKCIILLVSAPVQAEFFISGTIEVTIPATE